MLPLKNIIHKFDILYINIISQKTRMKRRKLNLDKIDEIVSDQINKNKKKSSMNLSLQNTSKSQSTKSQTARHFR